MKPAFGFWWLLLAPAHAGSGTPGPYPPAAGQPGSDAIAATDARFRGWATSVVSLVRGRTDIADEGAGFASYGFGSSALGPSDLTNPQNQPEFGTTGPFPVVSLGDGGSITLRFAPPIADGPGPDFAVFENSFNSTFLELAFVEVSSDGIHFVRFPAISCTGTASQVTLATTGATNATNLKNLAGKYQGGFGTPFDLAEFSDSTMVDIGAVTHVRILDVIGSIDPALGTRDSQDHLINDPYPTDYETGGFDLDAIGVLNEALTSYSAWKAVFSWTAAEAAPAADPDRDGIPNAMEYALATDPLRATPPPAIGIAREGNKWIAIPPSCRTGATDLVCGVEISGDLKAWTYHGGLSSFTLGTVPSVPQRFCRLKIQLSGQP